MALPDQWQHTYVCYRCGRPFNGWKAGKEHEASCMSTAVDDQLDQPFQEENGGGMQGESVDE